MEENPPIAQASYLPNGTMTPPPQYPINSSDNEDIPPPKPDFLAPPPYEVATKLPTYEEVQREKTLQGEPTHPARVIIKKYILKEKNNSNFR